MNRTKYIALVLAVVTAIAVLAVTRKPEAENVSYLHITNVLPDITLTEIYLTDETVNILDYPLQPGDSFQIPLPASYSEVLAIDTEGGVYNSVIDAAYSDESVNLEISMENRRIFECTLESGGEFWTGEGSSTLRIQNDLPENDIYWLRVANSEAVLDNSRDVLGAFILFPGKVVNIRINPGTWFVAAEDNERDTYSCGVIEVLKGENGCWNITRENRDAPPEESGTGTSRLVLCNALGDWIITGVYHRTSSEDNWSANHITTGGIEPKQQYSLLLNPGKYDIRIVDEDNDTYTRFSMILSEEPLLWDVTMDEMDRFIP